MSAPVCIPIGQNSWVAQLEGISIMRVCSNIFNIALSLLAILLLAACNTKSDVQGNSANTLKNSLTPNSEKLYRVKFSKDFPSSLTHLKHCVDASDSACLDVYRSVIDARDALRALPKMPTLDVTLNIIKQSCASHDEYLANFTCYGALISLALYQGSEVDPIMFDSISNMPDEVQSIICNGDFVWFSNRSIGATWKNHLISAPIQWENPDSKSSTIDTFTSVHKITHWVDIDASSNTDG